MPNIENTKYIKIKNIQINEQQKNLMHNKMSKRKKKY